MRIFRELRAAKKLWVGVGFRGRDVHEVKSRCEEEQVTVIAAVAL